MNKFLVFGAALLLSSCAGLETAPTEMEPIKAQPFIKVYQPRYQKIILETVGECLAGSKEFTIPKKNYGEFQQLIEGKLQGPIQIKVIENPTSGKAGNSFSYQIRLEKDKINNPWIKFSLSNPKPAAEKSDCIKEIEEEGVTFQEIEKTFDIFDQ